ncbi:MAG: Crp/Fnr family transcriptional regulator [Alphaproteobacteria bacterium]|nr:MAG: Crp/Fnr family transcriptional regulator [Alphaproteobacteria bacterium]
MPDTSPSEDPLPIRNRILTALRPAAQDFIAKRVITRPFSAGEVIYQHGAPFTHAVFPHEGALSLMAYMEDGRSVEKASIGLEGFLGFVLLMGGGDAISTSVARIPGHASWLSIAHLDEALAEFVCVRETMLRYAKALISQTMESVACNSLHSAEQRIARWLLHAHDRVEGDRFLLTQQALAESLGLRRATVSEACSEFQRYGLLDYTRGVLTVVDRVGLEGKACECYGRVRQTSLL